MTDFELQNIINKLREFTLTRRQKDVSRHSVFFLSVIDIACCLTELGLYEARPIGKDEEYWFQSSYHMNFWDADIETSLYTPLVEEVGKRRYFKIEKLK